MLAVGLLALTLSSTAADEYADLTLRLTRHTRKRYVADLDEVKRRGVLRVLTRNNSEDYFIAKGVERGFQYEFVRAFAKELGVRVSFYVPHSRAELIEALLTGQGDIIAAGMTATPARSEKVRFSVPVMEVPRVIVTRAGLPAPPRTVEDLVRFPIHLSFRSTTFVDAFAMTKTSTLPIQLIDVTDGVEMEEMMRRVVAGDYPATIVDRNLAELAIVWGEEIETHLSVGEPHKKAWAIHPAAPDLQAAADRFVSRSKKDGLYRIFYHRYYKAKARKHQRNEAYRADAKGVISPYDDLFKKAGEATGLDWRLIAAVAYTESRFEADAASAWGAVGLMQVLPSTAKGLGVRTGLERPEVNVMVGARYLKRLLRYFEKDEIEVRQRIRFALAAYNAGLGHVLDARELARLTGKDPNKWFGEVAEAIMLKRDRKWHEKTKYGYCRAGETTAYVSSIQARYDVYVQHVPL